MWRDERRSSDGNASILLMSGRARITSPSHASVGPTAPADPVSEHSISAAAPAVIGNW